MRSSKGPTSCLLYGKYVPLFIEDGGMRCPKVRAPNFADDCPGVLFKGSGIHDLILNHERLADRS